MSNKERRHNLQYSNNYQKQVSLLVCVPSLFFCVLITISTLFFHKEIINTIIYEQKPTPVELLNQWSVYMICTLWFFFSVIIVWTFKISNSLLGSFKRIIHELDEIIETGKRKKIEVRESDDMAAELLARVNVLVRHMPEEAPNSENSSE